jgi:sulfite oxidase
MDSQHNRQPETAESVWNIRGLLNNSYHKVDIKVVSHK